MVTKRTIELSVGDYLVDEFGTEIEIFNITILEGEFIVYDLGVEDNDLYIAKWCINTQ
jgi:intein/homing endonuclease